MTISDRVVVLQCRHCGLLLRLESQADYIEHFSKYHKEEVKR